MPGAGASVASGGVGAITATGAGVAATAPAAGVSVSSVGLGAATAAGAGVTAPARPQVGEVWWIVEARIPATNLGVTLSQAGREESQRGF